MDIKYKVCVLTPAIHDTISQELLSGILGRGLTKNVKLTIVSAGGIKSEEGLFNSNRILYKNVLSNEKFDGIIVLTGSMSKFASEEELSLFLNDFHNNIPLVNIAIDLPGFKSIHIDNITPMEIIVDHLINVHNKSKIMFIKGVNKQIESEYRLTGYKNALIKNNIKIDSKYILQGDFSASGASEILKNFLDSGNEFPDSIVCVNDETALGVYTELKNRKIKIGIDGIAITGFDNMNYSKIMEPCLTTVEQSFINQGRYAVDQVLSMIDGSEITIESFTPKVIYRKSCGCSDCSIYTESETEVEFLESIHNQLDDVEIDGLEDHIDSISGKFKKFVIDNSYNFVNDIKPYIELYKYKGYNLNTLVGIVKFLSSRIIADLNKEDLVKYYKQVDEINEKIITALSHEHMKEFRTFNEQSSELDSVLMALATCLEYKELEEVLNTNFYYLGIKDFSLVFTNSDNINLTKLSNKIFCKDDSLNRSMKEYCTLYLPVTSKYETGYCQFNILLNSFHIGEVLSYQISRAIYLIELFDSLNSNIEDIERSYTDLRETKDLLMENEQLANIGGLVAGFTHEISTPIGVSVTATSHLMDEVNRFRNLFDNNQIKKNDMSTFIDESEETIQILLNNLKRTTTLINGFKQISVDQASDVKRSFELGSYLQEIAFSLKPILRRGNHKVHINSEPGIILNSYPGAISQIITNLIQNSIKHGFENIMEGEIDITVQDDENRVTIIYRDNGLGIKKELQEKIFETYYSTKIGNGGSGLGLSIIKKLTENQLLGSIKCSSDHLKGVIFTIILPH